MVTTNPPPKQIVPGLPPMVPVAANNKDITTVVVTASGTDPMPRLECFSEPYGLTEPPNMQPFGDNVDIFGPCGNPDRLDLPTIPNGTDNTAGVAGLGLHGSGSPLEWENMGALTTPFPSSRPTPVNCFTNQDDALFDDGYDSEEALPFYDDLALDETADHYEEEAISGGLDLSLPAAAHASSSIRFPGRQHSA